MPSITTSSSLAGVLTPLDATTFGRLGSDLHRPECVLVTARGTLYTSDRRGGVMCISPQGTQSLLGRSNLVPNGIALQRDSSFLIANLGEDGGVWHLDGAGQIRPWLMEFEGHVLPRVNYVTTDAQERHWICVSATKTDDHYPVDEATGYILLQDASGLRCVADNIRYTNEVRITPDGQWLYVNETFGRCLTRFRLAADGALSQREVVAQFDAGDFPDGLTLDAEGGVWVVCVGSNRVYRVAPDGSRHTVIDDADPACVARLEQAFVARQLTRSMMAAARGRNLQNITSLAFGGPDMRTAYMGSLDAHALMTFRSPVAGLRPDHWDWA
jgi:sugar lactone lactonase YvrE